MSNVTSPVGGVPVGRASVADVGTGAPAVSVASAAAIVPVGEGSGMGGAAPVLRARRIGPGVHGADCTAALPPMVKVTLDPACAHPGR